MEASKNKREISSCEKKLLRLQRRLDSQEDALRLLDVKEGEVDEVVDEDNDQAAFFQIEAGKNEEEGE